MTMPAQKDARLWLAILHEIDELGGAAQPEMVRPRMRAYFPSLTDEDVNRLFEKSGFNAWTMRIHFARQELVQRGLLDGSTRGLWRLSDAGRLWLHDVWRGPDADYRFVPRPALLGRPTGRSAAPEQAGAEAATLKWRRLSHTEAGANADGLAPKIGRLVERTLLDGRKLTAGDHYLLAVVSYELDRFADAATLLDRALALGLPDPHRAKADRLRAICELKIEVQP